METVRVTFEIPANVATSLAGFLESLKVAVETKNNYVVEDVLPLPQSVDEVVDYCKANGLVANGVKFYNFYSKTGWKTTKGKPIDDWQKLLRKWDDGDRAKGITKPPASQRERVVVDDISRLAAKYDIPEFLEDDE